MEEQTEYRTYTCNLRAEQVRMLKSLPNASKFIRESIDKALKIKVKKPKSPKKKELTTIDKRIVRYIIGREQGICDSSVMGGYPEFKEPHRFIGKPVNWPMQKSSLLSFVEEEEIHEYIKTCSQEKIDEIFEEAISRWLSKYPIEWRVQITPEWTLGQVMLELEKQNVEEITVAEVAAIMGVSYNVAYNKAMPLLMAEGITFICKRKGTLQFFTLENLGGSTAKNYDKILNEAIWELHLRKFNSTQISKQLNAYPAIIRKRLAQLKEKKRQLIT